MDLHNFYLIYSFLNLNIFPLMGSFVYNLSKSVESLNPFWLRIMKFLGSTWRQLDLSTEAQCYLCPFCIKLFVYFLFLFPPLCVGFIYLLKV